MKCGKGHEHASVAEVRACYGVTEQPTNRPNKYAGDCARCGVRVEAEQGHIEPSENGWNVLHDGDCPPNPGWPPMDSDDMPPRTLRAPAQVRKRTEQYAAIPEGRYAVKSLTGTNDLDFFKVDKPTQGTWAGQIFVRRVIGGHPDMPVKGANKFAALDAILEAGPDKAMALFGQTLGYCGRCGRSLTDEQSRAIGIGPVCRAA
jgi:uncharacterized protein DUF6011